MSTQKSKRKAKGNGDSLMLTSKSVGSLDATGLSRIGNTQQLQQQQQKNDATGIPSLNPSQVATMMSKAQALYNSGTYTEALSCCDKIYEIDTFRTDNLLLLGAVHFQLRNFSESIFYNQQCIRVDPNFAEAYSNLGNALKELGDLKGATQFYLKAIQLKPRFCDAYNNLASAYMLQGQTQQAMETYQMSLVLNPLLADAHTNLGNLYKATGDMEAAKRCYLESIRIKPEFPIAWNNLAGVFKEEGQTATAIAYYREAIRLCPEFADAHSNLGNALKEQSAIQDAIACYQTAIKLRPDFAIAHGNLGSCYYDIGDFQEAINSFNYAIQLEPNFPDAYNNLGNALKEERRLDEAINAYRSALHLKSDHPHAYNNLGNAMIEKGFIKEAIHCYVTAIRLMPKFSAAHSNLGSVFKEQGKLDQAITHYLEAIKIDPGFADAYSNLGNAYKETGFVQDAMKCYATAIQLEPNYAEAYANYAAAHKDSGQILEAISLYRKALELRPDFGEAIANLTHSLVVVCDWKTRPKDFAKLQELLQLQLQAKNTVPCIQPFHSLIYPLSLTEMLQISKRYANRAKMNVALVDSTFRYRPKSKSAPLRIGYVSSDFGNHPLSHLLQSVFGMHNRRKVEVFCYALSPSDGSRWRNFIEDSVRDAAVTTTATAGAGANTGVDSSAVSVTAGEGGVMGGVHDSLSLSNQSQTQSLNSKRRGSSANGSVGAADAAATALGATGATAVGGSASGLPAESRREPEERFVDISGMHSAEAAARINSDNIHILINLNGYTKGSKNEIFALRPAPIQVSFMGFCGTMGADYIDYLVADDIAVPDQLRSFYQEKILSMPHSYFINDHRQSSRAELQSTATSAGIATGGIAVAGDAPAVTHSGAGDVVAAAGAAHLLEGSDTHAGEVVSGAAPPLESALQDAAAMPLPSPYTPGLLPPTAGRKSRPDSGAKVKPPTLSGPMAAPLAAPVTRERYGISEDAFVYCNFNQLYKIDPDTFTVWMNMLKRVENSVLWLLRFPPAGEANILREARERGIRSERIVFSDVVPREEHIQRGFLADLFLDTPLCNAHTTACDILWSGTPMITMMGEKMCSRVAASLISATGLGDQLICKTLQDYEELGVTLAQDASRLYSMRMHLERTRFSSAAFDTQRWVRNLEKGLQLVWKRHEQNLPADHVKVEDNDPIYVLNDSDYLG